MFDFFDDDLSDELAPAAAHSTDKGSPVASATAVYRIEMPDGCGPWCGGPNSNRDWDEKLEDWGCADLAEKNGEQMGETEQAFRAAHGHAAYGCDSLDALKKWFPAPARKFLATKGATVKHYEIAAGDYIERVGNGEVVFNWTTAKIVATLDLATI